MDAQRLIIMAVMGIVAGWLASMVVGVKGGLVGMLIAGLLGSIVGGFLFSAIGLKLGVGNPTVDSIIQSAIGAVVVILLARMFL
ncbi:MAG: GlsB/YeaQ/YmgE family stress response membrane protein [Hyphomicrobiaceae bacterium]|nr:GlsB/YeaQ/YmgE family stress response membrane protein [Hyphomicrobiaceae bacterium]